MEDSEAQEAGTFQRASADVLAGRKIFKSRLSRSSGSDMNGGNTAAKVVNPFGSTAATATAPVVPPVNPFAGFKSLTTPSSNATATAALSTVPSRMSNSTVATAPAVKNPFANFTGLTTSSSSALPTFKPTAAASATSTGTSGGPFSATAAASGVGLSFNDATIKMKSTTAPPLSDPGDKNKKIKKLNEAFLRWSERQMDTNPLSIWKDGVKDYIKHFKQIEDKYSANSDSNKNNDDNDSNKLASASLGANTSSSSSGSDDAKAKPASLEAPAVVSQPQPPAAVSGNTTFSWTAPPSSSDVGVPKTAAPPAFPGFSFKPQAADTKSGGSAATVPFTVPKLSFPPMTNSSTSNSGGAGAGGAFGAGSGLGASFLNTYDTKAAMSASVSAATTTTASTTTSNFFGAATAGGGAGDTAAAGGGGGEEEEGEPILEPEKVLKNSEDTDEILLDVNCKLYGYNSEEKEWKDTGKGTFRITKDIQTQKQRMLVRNPIGRINFNAGFYSAMKIEQQGKNGIKFAALVTVEDPTIKADGKAHARTEMKNFLVKVNAAELTNVITKMKEGVASATKK